MGDTIEVANPTALADTRTSFRFISCEKVSIHFLLLLKRWAKIAAIWIKAASLPSGIPTHRIAVRPTIFAIRQSIVNTLSTSTPLIMAFNSGMPEWTLSGQTIWTNFTAKIDNKRPVNVHTPNFVNVEWKASTKKNLAEKFKKYDQKPFLKECSIIYLLLINSLTTMSIRNDKLAVRNATRVNNNQISFRYERGRRNAFLQCFKNVL